MRVRWVLITVAEAIRYRILYEEDIKMVKDDCIFCKIAGGKIPSATIYETPEFKAMLDVAPANKGHVLIIPKEHYDNIFEIDGETAGKLFSLATVVARAVREETGCEGLNVVQNNGEVAGQTVNHFHMHLIPRHRDDGVSLIWKQHDTDPAEQEALAAAIRKRI